MMSGAVDLERLLKLRLVAATFGEVDGARWWNMKISLVVADRPRYVARRLGRSGTATNKEAVNPGSNARFGREVDWNVNGTTTFIRRQGVSKLKPLKSPVI
jgi:hypothetical protein